MNRTDMWLLDNMVEEQGVDLVLEDLERRFNFAKMKAEEGVSSASRMMESQQAQWEYVVEKFSK